MRQLWQVPVFVLGVLAAVAVAARSHWLHDPGAVVFQAELAQLRQAIDSKDGKWAVWLDASPRLLAAAERSPALAGEAYFLLGSLRWRLSEDGSATDAETHRRLAEEYFEKALASQNVANWDQGQLRFRFGVVLYRHGQDLGRAVQLMKEGLQLGGDPGGGGCEIAVQAMLKQSNPNLDEALKISKIALERPNDNEEALSRARVLHGELLMRCQRWAEARHILEKAGKSASREVHIKSLVLQARCCEADGHMWYKAQKLWETLLKEPDGAVPGGRARILYALGLCAQNNDMPGDLRTAIDYFSQAVGLGGEEAQAAGLRLGEAQLDDKMDAALQAWTDALAQVQKPADYHNAYVSLQQVRDMIEAAWSKVMDKNFQAAQRLADLYERVGQPPKAELYRAQACEALARKMTGPEALRCFGRAAQAFEKAAAAAPAEDQADLYWRAGTCFQQAQQPGAAIRTLENFVKLGKNPSRLGQGWLALADAHAALKNLDKARQVFLTCIDAGDPPSADRARFRVAQIERSSGNFARALDYLKAISPRASPALQEDALFLHGALLMDMQNFVWAEQKLEEAIKKHPGSPAVWQTQADLARCCRKQAEQEKSKFDVSSTDDIKAVHQRQWREKLVKSATTYSDLASSLKASAAQDDLSELTDAQLELLRLALFSHADILVELGDVEDAVGWYQYLQKNYSPQVESLIACERLWRCVPHIRQSTKLARDIPQIIRASLDLADKDLRGMDAGSPVFSGPNVLTKQEWQDWINRVKEQISRPLMSAPR